MRPHRARIILVEDNDAVRQSLTILLRTRGYAVEQYRHGIELLNNRVLPEADCLLIDYKMPLINGIELLDRLRKNGFTIPALLITGVVSTTLTARALSCGFVQVIEKPDLDASLIEHIESLLENAEK